MSYTKMRFAKHLACMATGITLSATLLVGCSQGNKTETIKRQNQQNNHQKDYHSLIWEVFGIRFHKQ